MNESMHNTYETPFSSRYASEEMQYLFSPDNKFRTWRRLWIALAETERELGLPITEEQIAELKAHADDINYDVAKAREKEVRHDVMSHVYAYGQQCPKAKGIIHLGATSCYVGDNTDIIIMKQALILIRKKLINTIASALGKTTGPMEILIFLGQPIVAIGLGLLVAIFGLGRNLDRHTALSEMEKGMMSAGIIMLVTGGGGALGQIIKDSGLGTYIAEGLSQTAIPIIILPLIISTLMRFIQGSGTVAMTTAASISAPIIVASGVSPLLGSIACCVGSLFFGYFNDSYFWVVNRTLGVKEAKDQLITWSVTSTIAWAVGVIEVLILSFFM